MRDASATIEKLRTPPRPRTLPIVGSLLDYNRDPFGYFTNIRDECGDISHSRILGRDFYMLYHPRDIEHVLVANNKNYIKDRFLQTSKSLFGNGLLTSEGGSWLRQRRLMQPQFHRQKIAGYAQVMIDLTVAELDTWRLGETRDVHRDMMRLTLAIAIRTLFGQDVEDRAEAVGRAFSRVTEHFQRISRLFVSDNVPIPANIRYWRALEALEEIVFGIIAKRRAQPSLRADAPEDLLAMLLAARDEDGQSMSDTQVRDEVMTLFLAGHETTALNLTFAWYLLAKNPAHFALLRRELEHVLGGRTPTLDDLPKLVLTEQIIKEALRLYPPAYAVGREALADDEIQGFHIRKGGMISMPQWAVHRDPRFFAAPEAFMPERWTAELEQRLPRYAYFPFGGGPRLCIGNSFAMMEARLALAAMAQRFRPVLAEPEPITLLASITLRPKNGLRVTLGAL